MGVSTTEKDSLIPWGTCRQLFQGDNEDSKYTMPQQSHAHRGGREKFEKARNLLLLGPIVLIHPLNNSNDSDEKNNQFEGKENNNCSIVICRNVCSGGTGFHDNSMSDEYNSTKKEDSAYRLCYDDSIRIVFPSPSGNVDNLLEMIHDDDDSCYNNAPIYRIIRRTTTATCGGNKNEKRNNNDNDDYLYHHQQQKQQHSTQTHTRQLVEIATNNRLHHPSGLVSGSPFLTTIPPFYFPTPLLSITLRQMQVEEATIKKRTQKQQQPHPQDPLRQSCIKRQLVGCAIAFSENNIVLTTRIHVPFIIHGTEESVVLQVESILEQSKRGYGDSDTSLFYWILPSTRITLIVNDNNKDLNHQHQSDDPSCVITRNRNKHDNFKMQGGRNGDDIIFSSPVVRRMMETVQCIRGRRQERERISNKHDSAIMVPTTFLLTGPPGVGKTYAVHLVYKECKRKGPTKLFSIQGSDLLASNRNNLSEASMELKRLFYKASEFCQQTTQHLAILFMDECDALFSSEPITAMLATLLDQVAGRREAQQQQPFIRNRKQGRRQQRRAAHHSGWQRLIVVAATNRIDCVPANLRRSGRLDQEIPVSPPTARERAIILQSLLLSNFDTDHDNSVDNRRLENTTKTTTTTAITKTRGAVVDEEMKAATKTMTNEKTPEQLSSSPPSPPSPPRTTPYDPQTIQELANDCVGYVPADLAALVRTASLLAILGSDTKTTATTAPQITYELIKRAMMEVGASALRDASMSAPPRIGWDDIAGDPGGAKMALRRAIEWPRTKQKAYQRLGLVPPRGILLYGPPGCAKTTLARAAAGATGVAFVSLSPADVYASSYVGEAEAVVRRAFTLARSTSPCILFFDEIDSIIGGENDSGNNNNSSSNSMINRGSSAESRVLSTFLNEMDGVDSNSNSGSGIMVLGATNRPWTLDAALLRPGRFDKAIYVPPPDIEGRISILRMQLSRYYNFFAANNNSDSNDDLYTNRNQNNTGKIIDGIVNYLASDSITGCMTGAEIVGACREAGMNIFREETTTEAPVSGGAAATQTATKEQNNCTHHITMDVIQRNVEKALREVKPLLSNKDVLDDYVRFEESRYK